MSVSTASSEAQTRVPAPGTAGLDSSRLVESDIASAAARVRGAENANPGADRMAKALAHAFELWRDRDYARRREAIAAIARSAGYSVAMLEDSIDALLKPFTSDALKSLAARVLSSGGIDRPRTVGFIAAGNVAGAGMHEIAIALVAGAGAKTPLGRADIFRGVCAHAHRDRSRRRRAHRGLPLEPHPRRSDRGVDCELRAGGGVRRRPDDRVASPPTQCDRIRQPGQRRPGRAGCYRSVAYRQGRGAARARCRIVRATGLPVAPSCVRGESYRRRSARPGDPNVGGARTYGKIDAAGENPMA